MCLKYKYKIFYFFLINKRVNLKLFKEDLIVVLFKFVNFKIIVLIYLN